MFGYELEGLKRLAIPYIKWGSTYRVKVRGRTNKMVYIGDVSRLKNKKLLEKQYGVSMTDLKKHLSPDYKADPKYRFYQGKHSEAHLYENIPAGEFYDKLENVLSSQKNSFKINIALGYQLVSKMDEDDTRYWHPNKKNTYVFDTPISINSKADIQKKVISQIRTMELADRLNYPSSGYRLKAITGFKIELFYRSHALGDSTAVLPKIILDNHHVINFPKTNNKCVFHCIAYHKLPEPKKEDNTIQDLVKNKSKQPKKDHRRIQTHVKNRFREYCTYKSINYTTALFKNFKPIDILQFDELEECFQLAINVHTMDIETGRIEFIRRSDKDYDPIHILSYENHALYIKNLDMFQSKFQCPKCEMVFETSSEKRDHIKNRCEEVNILSFPKEPKQYTPCENRLKRMLRKFRIKNLDHYHEHFIVYDFEAILKPRDQEEDKNTIFTNEHIPVSISISDTLTNEVVCFVDESPTRLMERMIEYIDEVSKKIQQYNVDKYMELLRTIISKQPISGNHIPPNPKLKALVDINITTSHGLEDIEKWIEGGALESFYDFHDLITSPKPDLKHPYFVVKQHIDQIPVLGFNSGNYDINLGKNELFSVLGDRVRLVIKNPSYMCISTDNFKMLDIMNYVPAGTSLDSYLTTYLGGCTCNSNISCTCGLTKGVFPYEYITSYEVLNETRLPPKSAFYSELRQQHISDEDYERVEFVWKHYGMKTIKDLLIWYNNLDVTPFAMAIKKQREFFKRFELDMFSDGVSLPGLAEKIMYQTASKTMRKQPKVPGKKFHFDIKRFNGYRTQDKEADREFDMTITSVNDLLRKQKFMCTFCYCQLTKETASVDRINNSIGHQDDNIMISCINCNVARKDMSISGFRHKKLLDFNADRLVYSIDLEESAIYSKMKANIAGGPSIIFNRYAKRNETKIRGDKICKKVIGYDANALYLWCLGNDMPCGRLTTIDAYEGIINDIKEDKIFGFLECDINTPEHLKDYFSEMTPIFKNTEIDVEDESVIGSHMYNYNQDRKKAIKDGALGGQMNFAKKSRKLIGSYFGEKILIYTPLLKWYLDHGMRITKTYSFIKASAFKVFKPFMEDVSNARREGDVDKSKEMIADMMKLVGNSAFGRSGMDMTKHKRVEYLSDEERIRKKIEHFTFHGLEEFNDSCEIVMKKRRISAKNPIHLSIAIYQLAKLRMLQFYYDCIDFYFDRSDFEYQEMDTDSGYIAFTGEKPFPDLIKPELCQHFEDHKSQWFPRDDNEDDAKFDRRTPGLFKEEWRGDAMISLSSKNYICYLPDSEYKLKKDKKMINGKEEYYKVSAKGVQQKGDKNTHILCPDGFEKVIRDHVCLQATNRGFRISKETKGILTYRQTKTGLNYYYDKRQVLADGISTIPLNI